MEGVSEIMITYLPVEKEDADKAKTKIEKFGAKCHIYEVDLTEQGACKKLADAAVKTMGSVNILFNNAAYQKVIQDPIKDLSEEHWVKTFDTNIHPFWFLSKYLAPQMKRGDTIINNASINA
jgi:NAD(P)-dependent dehydrogenase (short-subunit alcohol dehydrogenase family)